MHATLRPYQQHGVDWLAFLRDAELGAVLADDMGLGKTLQTICVLRGRALVVCPKSVVYNWVDEIDALPPRSAHGASTTGPKRALDRARRRDAHDLRRAPPRRRACSRRRTWDIVVLDEAQAIKNPDSQMARAAFELRGQVPRRCSAARRSRTASRSSGA